MVFTIIFILMIPIVYVIVALYPELSGLIAIPINVLVNGTIWMSMLIVFKRRINRLGNAVMTWNK